MEANQYNGMTLAYIGDAIYELYIRKYVLDLGKTKVKEIHKLVTNFVNANTQAKYMAWLLEKDILTSEEKSIYLRGRNAKVSSNRKNVDLANYHEATGFEALFGYLHLLGNNARIELILKLILNWEDNDGTQEK